MEIYPEIQAVMKITKKICQNHQICQADFSLTNLTKIH